MKFWYLNEYIKFEKLYSKFSIIVTKNYWGERIINNSKIKYIPVVYF